MRRASAGGVRTSFVPQMTSVGTASFGSSSESSSREQRSRRALPGLRCARQDHLAGQLDVTRLRVPAEPDARDEQPEVREAEHPAGLRHRVRDPVEHPEQAGAAAERRARQRREQDDAGDPLRRDLRVPEAEELDRDPAHRVPDEHRIVQIEALDDRADVAGERVRACGRPRRPSTRRGRGGRTRSSGTRRSGATPSASPRSGPTASRRARARSAAPRPG